MSYELSTQEPVKYFQEETLRGFCVRMLSALGANEEETQIITDGLLTASKWWHPGQGQGLEKFFRYARRVEAGGIVPDATMSWVKDGPAYALLDANQGFGYVAAHRAMLKAVEKAKQSGIGFVIVKNSNHFGIAGYHALTAAKANCIGWSMTNAKAEMAPWGSAKPVLGTNPWGIAIPSPAEGTFPVVLDMALTMSGKGMMRWFLLQDKPIPESWALTKEGQVTTDAAAAMDGPLLPIGEYKGYGLSFVTDVLSGVMSGAKFGLSVFQDDADFDVGHTMIAINPFVFMDESEFKKRLAELIAEIKSAPPIDSASEIRLPGETEQRRALEREQQGIPVATETLEQLSELAAKLNVSFDL